jgi:hydroxymethylglutaryl-CoA lyase
MIKLIECPRDAMQGIRRFIPTGEKIAYLELLMDCGFDSLDCGSFVSDAYVPQMSDTGEVLRALSGKKGENRFLVIVANERGAVQASGFECVDDLGFPFSINETFQKRNTNSGILDSFLRLQKIKNIADASGKKTVAYISMAFGNPYGEPYNREDVLHWVREIAGLGITTISLADTSGDARTEDIEYLFNILIPELPEIEFGAHFHALPGAWLPKIEAAWNAGCRRFDGALLGYGGCPMARDELTGNIPTGEMAAWLKEKGDTGLNFEALSRANAKAVQIFT